MNICILGAGSLGSAIGGVLAAAGSKVWLVSRDAAHVDAINRRGLELVAAGERRIVPVPAAIDCAGLPIADLVIVLVKSLDTRAAIEAARPIIGTDTIALSLQNGLGHDEVLADVVPRDRILCGKTYTGGRLLAPGRVQIGIQGKHTIIGEPDGSSSERAQRIAALFTQAGMATTVTDNVAGMMWDKLFVNVATGALSAITRLAYGPLYRIESVEQCAIAAVAEAMAVARAAGIRFATTEPRQAWELAAAGLPPDFKASMLQSLEKGAPTEIDFVNGAVVRTGSRVGVPTPINQTLLACVKGIEASLGSRTAPTHAPQAYVEHVAVHVADLSWHVRFFCAVLGASVREVDGPADAPRQVWLHGGMQLVAVAADTANTAPTPERLGHLGVMCEDVEATIAAAERLGAVPTSQGRNWLRLPDGLVIELLQATGDAVDRVRRVDPRQRS